MEPPSLAEELTFIIVYVHVRMCVLVVPMYTKYWSRVHLLCTCTCMHVRTHTYVAENVI